jgi:hypothetical protein
LKRLSNAHVKEQALMSLKLQSLTNNQINMLLKHLSLLATTFSGPFLLRRSKRAFYV